MHAAPVSSDAGVAAQAHTANHDPKASVRLPVRMNRSLRHAVEVDADGADQAWSGCAQSDG